MYSNILTLTLNLHGKIWLCMFGPYNIVENQMKILMWSEFTLFYKFQANAPSFFYMMFMKGIISSCVNCDNPNFCLPTLSHSNIQSAPAVSSDKEGMALCVALCLISTIQLGIPNCEIIQPHCRSGRQACIKKNYIAKYNIPIKR